MIARAFIILAGVFAIAGVILALAAADHAAERHPAKYLDEQVAAPAMAAALLFTIAAALVAFALNLPEGQ